MARHRRVVDTASDTVAKEKEMRHLVYSTLVGTRFLASAAAFAGTVDTFVSENVNPNTAANDFTAVFKQNITRVGPNQITSPGANGNQQNT
jgi:hypothetical protein